MDKHFIVCKQQVGQPQERVVDVALGCNQSSFFLSLVLMMNPQHTRSLKQERSSRKGERPDTKYEVKTSVRERSRSSFPKTNTTLPRNTSWYGASHISIRFLGPSRKFTLAVAKSTTKKNRVFRPLGPMEFFLGSPLARTMQHHLRKKIHVRKKVQLFENIAKNLPKQIFDPRRALPLVFTLRPRRRWIGARGRARSGEDWGPGPRTKPPP